MLHLLEDMQASTGDSADLTRCITEDDTPSGYWWCYRPAAHHPNEAVTAMIHIRVIVQPGTRLRFDSATSLQLAYRNAQEHPCSPEPCGPA
jgi:hypothetical protein